MVKQSAMLLITLSLCLAAGCNRSGGNNSAKAANGAANAAVPAVNDGANAAGPAREPKILQLAAEGLTLPGGAMLRFGASPAEAVQQLQAVLGAPASREPETDTCNAGMRERISWQGGLTTFFTADGFVGWVASAAEGGKTLRTANGMGPGATRAEVQAAGATFEEGAENGPPPQFRAGAFSGALNSTRPDATVDNLAAGRTCAPEGGS